MASDSQAGFPVKTITKFAGGGLQLRSLNELFADESLEQSYLVDGLLPLPGSSIIVAPPKAGKSTLTRTLALAVARGERFLERECAQGSVIYLGFEENVCEVRDHFKEMGASGEESLLIHASAAPERALEALEAAVANHQPKLLIVDTLFRLVKIRDGNDYAQVTRELARFTDLARSNNFHLAFVHHAKKDTSGSHGDSILGSTALFGAVDTALFLKVDQAGKRTLRSTQRYGMNMEETVLSLSADRRIEVVGSVAHAHEQKLKSEILERLKAESGSIPEAVLLSVAKGRKKELQRLLRGMVGKEVYRRGSGRKGDPYLYYLPPSLVDGAGSKKDSTSQEALSKEESQS